MKIFAAHHILSLSRSSDQVSQEFLKDFWTMDLCWRAYKPWIWFGENQVLIFLQEEKDRPVGWTDQREGTPGTKWIKQEGTQGPQWITREGTPGPQRIKREEPLGPRWINREGTLEPRWSKREGT